MEPSEYGKVLDWIVKDYRDDDCYVFSLTMYSERPSVYLQCCDNEYPDMRGTTIS